MRFDPVEEPSPRFPGRSFAVPFVLTSHLQTSNATRLLVRVFPAPPAYLKAAVYFYRPLVVFPHLRFKVIAVVMKCDK